VPPPHSPPDSYSKTSVSSHDPNNNTKPGTSSIDGDENQFGDPALGRSSSEEKESMTPAQTKRKAQNRAAYVITRARSQKQYQAGCSVYHSEIVSRLQLVDIKPANRDQYIVNAHSANEKRGM
jgi:hypothetical protein